jgi:Fe-S-cluster formation regulator IscX/YfhJ
METEFSRQLFEKYSNTNFINIRPVETDYFMQTDRRTDGWTDMTKVIVPFRNFVNAPKNCLKKILLLRLYVSMAWIGKKVSVSLRCC